MSNTTADRGPQLDRGGEHADVSTKRVRRWPPGFTVTAGAFHTVTPGTHVGIVGAGVLPLTGGRASRVGWVGSIAVQVALVLFGRGFLLWSVPFGVLLVFAARHDWPLPISARPVARLSPRGP